MFKLQKKKNEAHVYLMKIMHAKSIYSNPWISKHKLSLTTKTGSIFIFATCGFSLFSGTMPRILPASFCVDNIAFSYE